MSNIDKIRQEIESLKELNEGLYTEGDNSYYEGQDNGYNHILAFLDCLPEEASCIYDTNELTPTHSVNIEDVARVQFASHAHVFDRKRKAVFDWEHFKEVAGIFYGFGKRDSLPEDDIPKIEGWIARNKDGSLVFCYHKPKRENSITQEWWGSCDADFRIYDDTIDEQFKDLKWEDEPREVELIIKCRTCKESLQVQETCKENTDSFTDEPKELEVAAEEYIAPIENDAGLEFINFSGQDIKDAFIAGAEWQAKQLLKGSPLPEDTILFQKGVEEGRRLEREDRNDDNLPRYYGD